MKLLTKEQQDSYENAKSCYIYEEKFENKYLKDKIYRAEHSICNLKYSELKEIPTVFLNGSNYDHHNRVSRRN